jgi:hypothetical protein
MAAVNILSTAPELSTWLLDDLSRTNNHDEHAQDVSSSRWAVNPESHRWRRITEPSPLEWTRLQALGANLEQLPAVDDMPDVDEISGITMALEGEMALASAWHDAAASYVRGCETLLACLGNIHHAAYNPDAVFTKSDVGIRVSCGKKFGPGVVKFVGLHKVRD